MVPQSKVTFLLNLELQLSLKHYHCFGDPIGPYHWLLCPLNKICSDASLLFSGWSVFAATKLSFIFSFLCGPFLIFVALIMYNVYMCGDPSTIVHYKLDPSTSNFFGIDISEPTKNGSWGVFVQMIYSWVENRFASKKKKGENK